MISKFTAKIDADTKKIMRKMREVQAETEKLQEEITVKINANVNDAIADMAKVQKLAQQLDGKNVDIQIDADTVAAVTQLERAKQIIDDLRNDMNNITVRIRANIRQFNRAITRVRAELLKLKEDANIIDVKANITDFMRDILQVRSLAQELENKDIEIRVRLQDKVLDDILQVLYEVEALDKETAKIKVALELSVFYTQLAMVYAEIQALSRQSATVTTNMNVNGNSSDVMQAVAEVKAAILALRDVTIDIHADISNFMRGAAVVRQTSNQLNNKNIVVKIWTDFTNAMQAYAVVVRAFAEAGQQILGGSVLALIPTLVPIVSVLIGLIGNMGVMLGVAATSAFALVTALGAAAIGAGAFAAVAIPTIKTLFDETAKLNAEQKAAKQSFDDFKATYDGLVKATEQPVLSAFTSAMNAANKVLQALEPMFLSVADAVAGLMESLNQSIDSQPLQDFFSFLNNDAAGLLTSVGEAVGYLIQGLLNMMTAFGPLAKDTANGFRDMAKGFADWANGLSQSERFNELVAYVMEYMPLMRQAFKDLIVGVVEFFTAFADQSQGFIQGFADMMSAFREWASALGENDQFQRFLAYIQESTPAVLALLGNLWQTLVGLGVAMAPMAAHVLSLVNSFLQWFSAALQAEGMLAKIVGILPVLMGVITALVPVLIGAVSIFGNIGAAVLKLLPIFTNLVDFVWKVFDVFAKLEGAIGKVGTVFARLLTPVGLVVTAITTIIAALVLAYNKVGWFRDMVDEAWNHIKTVTGRVFSEIAETLKTVWTTITNLVEETLKLIKKLWEKYGDEISLVVRAFATVVQGLVQGLMTLLFGIIETGWNLIVGAVTVAWELISGVVETFITLISGIVQAGLQLLQGDWEGAWNTIVETTESIAGTIVDTLSAIISTVGEIGSDIVMGLVNGIASGFDWVKKKVNELASLVPEWLKGPLGIKSPSRVMAAVAKWIPAGVAKGIVENLNVVRTAAKELAGATMPDFSKSMETTKQQVRAAQNAVSGVIQVSKKEIQKITSESNKKIADIESKLAKDIQSIQKGASNKKRSLTKAELSDIEKMRTAASKEIKAIEAKMGEEIAAKQSALNAEKLSSLTSYIDKQKELHGVSAAEEAAYWKYASTAFKDGTDDKMRALQKFTDAYNRAMQEQFDNEMRLIDESRKYGAMSRREELIAYEEYMKNYAKGSEQQVAYEREIYDAKKALYDDLKAVADSYLTKVQDVYTKLADEEQKLRDEYEKTFEARRDTLANTWGLFDEVNLTEMTTFKEDGSIDKQINLLDNMRQQVNTLSQWMQELSMLSHKIADEGLMKELQTLGPKAAAEIAALNRMSGTELQEYERLWKSKMALAGQQATTELAGARSDMESEVVKLRENATKELDKLKVDMLKEVDEMVNGTTDTFDILTSTLPEIGKHAMQGLIDAFKDMSGPLQTVLQGIASDVSSSMGDILMGEKFNATTATPTSSNVRGVTALPKVQGVATPAPAPTPVNINLQQNWTGEDVATYIDKQQGIDAKFNVIKRG